MVAFGLGEWGKLLTKGIVKSFASSIAKPCACPTPSNEAANALIRWHSKKLKSDSALEVLCLASKHGVRVRELSGRIQLTPPPFLNRSFYHRARSGCANPEDSQGSRGTAAAPRPVAMSVHYKKTVGVG